MIAIIEIYKKIYQENFPWLRRIGLWAGIWVAVGFSAYVVYPDLLPKLLDFLERVFRDIAGEGELALTWQTVYLIFKNNLTAALLAIGLGIFFGIIPLAAISINFFILGFLLSAFLFSGAGHFFVLGIGPHGVLELPAILLAAALGLRLGFFWHRAPDGRTAARNLVAIAKQTLALLPAIAALFFLAAIIEVFVTGRLVESLVR